MSDCLQFADKPLNKTNLALSFVPSDQLYSKLWENRTCELLEKNPSQIGVSEVYIL